MDDFLPFTILDDENSIFSEGFDDIFYCKHCGEICENDLKLVQHDQVCPKQKFQNKHCNKDGLLRKLSKATKKRKIQHKNFKHKLNNDLKELNGDISETGEYVLRSKRRKFVDSKDSTENQKTATDSKDCRKEIISELADDDSLTISINEECGRDHLVSMETHRNVGMIQKPDNDIVSEQLNNGSLTESVIEEWGTDPSVSMERVRNVGLAQKQGSKGIISELPNDGSLTVSINEKCVTHPLVSLETDRNVLMIQKLENKSLEAKQQDKESCIKHSTETVIFDTQTKTVQETVQNCNEEIENRKDQEEATSYPEKDKPRQKFNEILCDDCGYIVPQEHNCVVPESLPIDPEVSLPQLPENSFTVNSDKTSKENKIDIRAIFNKNGLLKPGSDNLSSVTVENFVCLQCGKSFLGTCNSVRIIDDEQLFNIGSSLFSFFRCEQCSALLSIKKKIKEGILSYSVDEFTPLITKDIQNNFNCRLCDENLTDFDQVKRLSHLLLHAQDFDKQCIICLQPLKSIIGIRVHMQKHKYLIKTTDFFRRIIPTVSGMHEHKRNDKDKNVDIDLNSGPNFNKSFKIQSSKTTKSSEITFEDISSADQNIVQQWDIEIANNENVEIPRMSESPKKVICNFSKVEGENQVNNKTTNSQSCPNDQGEATVLGNCSLESSRVLRHGLKDNISLSSTERSKANEIGIKPQYNGKLKIQCKNMKILTDDIVLGKYQNNTNNKKVDVKHCSFTSNVPHVSESLSSNIDVANNRTICRQKSPDQKSLESNQLAHGSSYQHRLSQQISGSLSNDLINNGFVNDLGSGENQSKLPPVRADNDKITTDTDVVTNESLAPNIDLTQQLLEMSNGSGVQVSRLYRTDISGQIGQISLDSATNSCSQTAQLTHELPCVPKNQILTTQPNPVERNTTTGPCGLMTSVCSQPFLLETQQPVQTMANCPPFFLDSPKTLIHLQSHKSNTADISHQTISSLEYSDSGSIIDDILELTAETNNIPLSTTHLTNLTSQLTPSSKLQNLVPSGQNFSNNICDPTTQTSRSFNGVKSRLLTQVLNTAQPVPTIERYIAQLVETPLQSAAPIDKPCMINLNHHSDQITIPQPLFAGKMDAVVTSGELSKTLGDSTIQSKQSIHSTTNQEQFCVRNEYDDTVGRDGITSSQWTIENIQNLDQQFLNQKTHLPNREIVTTRVNKNLPGEFQNTSENLLCDKKQHVTDKTCAFEENSLTCQGSMTNNMDENLSKIQKYMSSMKEDMTEEEEIAFLTRLNSGSGEPFMIASSSDEEGQCSNYGEDRNEIQNITDNVSNANKESEEIVLNFDPETNMENPSFIQEVEVVSSSNSTDRRTPEFRQPINKSKHGATFQCDLCTLSFKKKVYLLKHKELHLKNPLICWQCSLTFSSRENFEEHKQYTHGNS